MNERIKELYLQAHSIRNYDGDPMRDGNPPDVYWQGETSAERFAELIVRECVSTLGCEIVHNDNYTEKNKIISDMMELLKQHFGVEQ
jgi:hypothetical protein